MGPTAGIRRTAVLAASAFDETIARMVERVGDEATIDLRADAYGHGADEVERRARSGGVRRFVRTAADAAGHDPAHLLAPYGLGAGSQPLLRLLGEVIAVKRVPANTAVSYGYSYRTEDPSTLALIGLGYADGVPRLGSNRAPVRVGGTTGVVAGRIAMDQLVVDLADGDAHRGATAVLWDDATTLAAWATATERAPEALTAGLGRRIRRHWDDG